MIHYSEYLLDDATRIKPRLRVGWYKLSDYDLEGLLGDVEDRLWFGGEFFDGSEYEDLAADIEKELNDRL